jgi:hypothetical protein
MERQLPSKEAKGMIIRFVTHPIHGITERFELIMGEYNGWRSSLSRFTP